MDVVEKECNGSTCRFRLRPVNVAETPNGKAWMYDALSVHEEARRWRVLCAYATHDEKDRISVDEFDRILKECDVLE